MTISRAQNLAVLKYRAKVYDRVSIDVPKGKRDAYNLAAKELKLSLAMLIQNGVEEFIKNHAGEKVTLDVKPENQLSAADKKLIEAFGKCPEHVKPTLKKLIEQLAKGGGDNGND